MVLMGKGKPLIGEPKMLSPMMLLVTCLLSGSTYLLLLHIILCSFSCAGERRFREMLYQCV